MTTKGISISGRFWVKKDGKNYIGEGRVQLLKRIAATGSISQAAKDMGMSYKAAWDDVDSMNNLSVSPLVVRSTGGKKGGGTILTPIAYEILEYYEKLQSAFSDFISKAENINTSFNMRLEMNNPPDNELKTILENVKTIAMVGASNNPESASNHVMKYLMKVGYTVYPINPKENAVCEVQCYPSLSALPVKPDIIDVFRKSEFAAGIVKEAADIGVKYVWLQEGVKSEEASKVAAELGITLVSDICMAKTYDRLLLED